MKLYKIDWDCAMQQFQDENETSIIQADKEPIKKQVEKSIENMSTGSVYINKTTEVKESDIRHNVNNRFYKLKG